MKNSTKIFCITLVLTLTVGSTALAIPTFLGPTPYLSFADGPFNGLAFDAFFLEDFEDGALNTPGVSGNGFVFPPSVSTDSVDADDEAIDGLGLAGHSYLNPGPFPSVTFEFSPIVGGLLPTHVEIVWTDGLPQNTITTFEAFDALGISLGTIVANVALYDTLSIVGPTNKGGEYEGLVFRNCFGGWLAAVGKLCNDREISAETRSLPIDPA